MDKTVFWILGFLFGAAFVKSQDPSVSLNVNGMDVTVYGKEHQIEWEGQNLTIHNYFGLPFAEPPVGDLRFRKTKPLQSMASQFYAYELGMPCVQFNFRQDSGYPESEDCLYLNVYVPGLPADSSDGHAVAIWVHGGSYIEGTGGLYDGTFISLYGNVIVVTINYRLGVYGFLTAQDENAPGNYAFWDQHMAFQWVNEHIHQFGGDPSRVTIFGESAGAMSVSKQGLVPQNQGLFRRIIAQSGSPLHPPDYQATEKANHAGDLLNCDMTSSSTLFDCLRSVSNDVLKETLKNAEFPVMDLGYVVDYDLFSFDHSKIPWLIEDQTLDGVQFYRSLDVMNGFNEYDGLTITDIFFSYLHGKDYLISRDEMREKLKTSLGWLMGKPLDDSVIEMTLSEYTNWTDPENMENVRHQFIKLHGDWIFGAPAVKTAQIHAETSYTGNFLYYFTANPAFGPVPSPDWLDGPNHADELSFTFGVEMSVTELPTSSWEVQLSRKMVTYWTNFMKHGQNMVKTKMTARKLPSMICSICKEPIGSGENFQAHIEKCGEARVKCDECGVLFKRDEYRKRHFERFHSGKGVNSKLNKEAEKERTVVKVSKSQESSDESSEESSWDNEPDIELEEGRSIRKRTAPQPVFAPKRRCVETSQSAEKMMPTSQEILDVSIESRQDKEVQTEVADNDMIFNEHEVVITCPVDTIFYNSKEITVKSSCEFIEVKGYQKEVKGENNIIERSFARRYPVPPGVDHSGIKCSVAQGFMLIRMPMKTTDIMERDIPIDFYS